MIWRYMPRSYDAGIFKSANGGLDWSSINNGLTEATVNVVKIKQNLLFAGTQFSGVFKSSDYGNNWVQCINGMGQQQIYKMLVVSNGVILAGGNGLINRSADDGANWSIVLNYPYNSYVSSIIANENAGFLFASLGNDSGIVRSDLNGINWSSVNNGLTKRKMNALNVSPNGRLWAAAHDADWNYCLSYSDNNGNSWSEIDISNFDFTAIYTIACNSADQLFLGTNSGPFRSVDNGMNFERILNPGDTWTSVQALAFDSDGFLFAGINNRGVLKSVQSTIVATPNLVLPAEGATSVTLTPALTWDPVAIADKYQAQVCLDNTFIGGVVVDVTGISTTSYQITAGHS